jgi:hypothetical protein
MVAYCHNPRCGIATSGDPAIRLHQERDTGAWVPDSCPTCSEDLHHNELVSEAFTDPARPHR